MSDTHLTGLNGTNPLAFLAALGVQEAFSDESRQPKLWWSDDVVPHAVLGDDVSIEDIAIRALDVFDAWKESPAVNPSRSDGAAMKKADEVKFGREDIREYLSQSNDYEVAVKLPSALVAEGSLVDKGESKPSDLYFTAGQQKFLKMARDILNGTSFDDVVEALTGPWQYESALPSLMWDVSDDRIYALSASNPSTDKKMTNAGVEALAILGLSRHPVFARTGRTITQGCSGSWKSGRYSWPLWRKPASADAVKSLLAHGYDTQRQRWLKGWGIFRIMRSTIRRSQRGGYGTFGPPEIFWEAD